MGSLMPDLYKGKSRSSILMEKKYLEISKQAKNIGAIEHLLGKDATSGAGFTDYKDLGWAEFLSTGVQLFSVRIGSHSDYNLGMAPINDFWKPLQSLPGGLKLKIARHPGGFTLRLLRGDTVLSTYEMSE